MGGAIPFFSILVWIGKTLLLCAYDTLLFLCNENLTLFESLHILSVAASLCLCDIC